jgi:hypothetical protein
MERSPTQVCQADVGHSVRRVVDPSGDESASNQSLISHDEQVFKDFSFIREMFQIIIVQRENALMQARIYFL